MGFDLSGYWLRPHEQGLGRMRADYEDTALDAGGGWFGVHLGSASVNDDALRRALASSQSYGEVVFLRAMSTVAVFEYVHAQDGALRRHLLRVEGAWEAVAGESQAWEAELLFPAAQIARWRAQVDDPDDPEGRNRMLAQIAELERAGAVAKGAFFPNPNVERVTFELARHHGFSLRPGHPS